MRWSMLVCLLAMLAAGVAADRQLRAVNEEHLLGAKQHPRQAFWQWMAKHQKGYTNDLQEVEKRFRHWLDNLDFVVEYNAKQKSHWLGMNSLADLSHEEYKQKYSLGYNRFLHKSAENRLKTFRYDHLDEDTLPPAVDWREQNAVSEVKNQAQCGSCWAFSTTGSVEGINAIVTNELLSLSEQELVDCDTDKDNGCSGGLMDYAFEFIIKNKGITLESEYPYTAQDGTCQKDNMRGRVVTIDGYEDVPPYNEVALKKAASAQPVAVAIEADQRAFQLYMGGVFDDESCGEQLDHGVLLVGYGVEQPKEDEAAEEGQDDSDETRKPRNYWIIKNSWGDAWGDKGYIKLRMGRGKAGMCGIAMQPSYPIKKGPNPPAPSPKPGPKPGPKPDPPTPGPEPEPVECDSYNECPPSTTCCCLMDLGGFCFSWGCCPMEKATCCDDKEHCCPEDLPICDTKAGRCLPPSGALAGSAPWATKLPATRKTPMDSWWNKRQSDAKLIKPIAS